jgi:g-D-glutamyl-meso-diaminopimelate peptidase
MTEETQMSERIVVATDHYDYKQMIEHLNKLCAAYPFLRLSYIGQSVMGKPIPAIQVGAGAVRIHYNAAFHANEWLTSVVLLVFLEDYANAIQLNQHICHKSAMELFHQTALFLVPMINPDGVDLVTKAKHTDHPFYEQLFHWNGACADFSQWKANIRGVDLNDQFPAHWDIEKLRRSPEGPGPRDYPGYKPLSEPEAIAISEFTKRKDFHLVIALHTQGREIYWNYRGYEPIHAEWMARQLAEASGYESIKLMDSDAGYKDWFIQQYRRPGFTVEVGYGSNPLPMVQFDTIYREVVPLLVTGLSLLL